MSDLNTSNITVPQIATMARHLTDSNPHPQYLQQSSLLSVISTTVHLADLADVTYGSGVPEKSLLYYNGSGYWAVASVSSLLADAVIPYATTNTAGTVRLTNSTLVTEASDSSSVITPATLAAWGNGKSFLSSGNLYTTLSNIFADSSTVVPFDMAQLKNVTLVQPVSVGQVLAVHSYDSVFSSATWVNSEVAINTANRTTFGVVKVASPEEVLSGVDMTYEEMELSGHKVPSLASLKSIAGVQYVSRVTPAGSTVYTSIVGHSATDGPGYTTYGITTIVNSKGLVVDHIVRGGTVEVNGGNFVEAYVTGDNIVVSGSNTSSVPGIVSAVDEGRIYNLIVGSRGEIYANGDMCDVYLSGGYDPDAGSAGYYFVNFSNKIEINKNAHIHQLTVGTFYDEAILTNLIASNNTMAQGLAKVNSCGCVEHGTVNARASMAVNYMGRAYHITVRGDGAKITVNSKGYVEDLRCYSGATVDAVGGEINGMVVYGETDLIVHAGARVCGLVKYNTCNITSEPGAYIERVGFVAGDTLVYSSSTTDWNISSSLADGLVLKFSAGTHPTGLRRAETISSGGSTTTLHKFVPMAVETREPLAGDPDVNVYTMNISGLSVWEDVVSSATTVKWYITF